MSALRFAFQLRSELPKLAWCARMEEGSSTVSVVHGPWVETGDRFFVEGVWDGRFDEGRFDQACLFMGSGGRIVGERACFATPCHTLERLFIARTGTSLAVSNSLAFVLEACGLRLDAAYPGYLTDFWSVLRGLDRWVKRIPTMAGTPVTVCYYSNVEIDAGLRMTEAPKTRPAAWTDFAEYRRFLTNGLAQLWANASSEHRRVAYSPLSTLSSGYDSAAVTALCVDIGCRDALTFRTGVRYLDDDAEVADSGTTVGAMLGVRVKEFARSDWRAASEIAAAEIAACGDAFDLQLVAFESELSQKLFFTGMHGGSVWDRNIRNVGDLMRMRDPSGSSLGEFRLRVGFVHVPVPLFGAVRNPDIHAISNAPSMQPWTLGNAYDRPIPRRIVEEKGVARELFGQRKKGSFTAIHLGTRRDPRVAAFEEYYRDHRHHRGLLQRGLLVSRYQLDRTCRRWARWAKAYRLPAFFDDATRYDVARPGRPSLVVQWGNSVLQPRYRSAGLSS